MLPFRGGINTKEYSSLPAVQGDSQSLIEYIEALGLTIDLRFDEASGNLINYGSDGNSATVTACTYGQTNPRGEAAAYEFNGTTSICTFTNANVPATVALTTQRWFWVIKPNSAGEGNIGKLYCWGNGADGRLEYTLTRHQYLLDAGTNPTLRNTVGAVSFGDWYLLCVDYDDADALGLGRKMRFISGDATTPMALMPVDTDIAAVGALVPPNDPLNIGNRNATDSTFDGLMDLAGGGSGLWSPAGTPGDISDTETLRSLVFP